MMGWTKSTGGGDSNIYKSDGSHTEDSEDSHSSVSPTTER